MYKPLLGTVLTVIILEIVAVFLERYECGNNVLRI